MWLASLCFSLGRVEMQSGALGVGTGLIVNSLPPSPLLQEEFFLKRRHAGLGGVGAEGQRENHESGQIHTAEPLASAKGDPASPSPCRLMEGSCEVIRPSWEV